MPRHRPSTDRAGANGVILITTRKAQENVTRITLRQQTTVSGFSSELNLWRDPC